jgi:hypothetical protein
MVRIDGRIQKAGPKGATLHGLSRLEGLSISRTRYYLALIRKLREKQGVKVERLGKRFYYVKVAEPERPKQLRPERGDVELRGYWNYKSPDYESRNLNIDSVAVVPNNPNAILAAKARIQELVRHKLGARIASMLHFGISEAQPESRNHFLYRRGGGEWLEL